MAMEATNRNKRSIAIDIRSDRGMAVLPRARRRRRRVPDQLPPDALERRGLDPDSLARATHASCTRAGHGFGANGPDARDPPGYDASAFWARGGLPTSSRRRCSTIRSNSAARSVTARGAWRSRFGIASARFDASAPARLRRSTCRCSPTAMWILTSDLLTRCRADSRVPAWRRGAESAAHPVPHERRPPHLARVPAARPVLGRLLPAHRTRRAHRRPALRQHHESRTTQRRVHRDPPGRVLEAHVRGVVRAANQLDAPWAPVQAVEELLTDPQVVANGYISRSTPRAGRSSRCRVCRCSSTATRRRCIARRARRAHGACPARAGLRLGRDRRPPARRRDPRERSRESAPPTEAPPRARRAVRGLLVRGRAGTTSRSAVRGVRRRLHAARTRCARTVTGASEPAYDRPVEGRGTVRSWTLLRDAFLPGFRDDVPYVLVDVELDEHSERAADRPARRRPRRAAAPRRPRHRDVRRPRRRRRRPRVRAGDARHEPAVHRPHRGRGRRATRRARSSATPTEPLGAIAIDTARARSPTPASSPSRSTGSSPARCCPTAGGQAAVDGVSIVTANWIAEKLRINPRYCVGLPGLRADPGRGDDGGERGRDRRRRLRAHAPRAAQPARPLPREPDDRGRGRRAVDRAAGFWGPLSTIALPYNEYLQRYGAKRESMADVVVEARANGAAHPVVVLVRASAQPPTSTSRADVIADPIGIYDCDIPVDGVAAFVFTTAERARDLPQPAGVRRRLRAGHPERAAAADALAARRHHGRGVRDGPPAWEHSGLSLRRHRPPPALRRLLAVHLLLARGARLLRRRRGPRVRPGRRHRHRRRPPDPLRRRRARQRADARRAADARVLPAALAAGPATGSCPIGTVGLACHSSPHFGGAVLYSREPTLTNRTRWVHRPFRSSASMSDLVASRSPYIDGAFVTGEAGTFAIDDPSTGSRWPRSSPRRWSRSTPRSPPRGGPSTTARGRA